MTMQKTTLLHTLLSIYFTLSFKLFSTITETRNISDLIHYIETPCRNGYTLILFDVDDTLINSPINLNSGPWITYYWQNAPKLLPEKMAVIEELMWFVSKTIPCLPVDPFTAHLISICQKKQPFIFPLALTARPIYQKHIDGVQVTKNQLLTNHIDFSQTNFPSHSAAFHEGIFFTSGKKKGDFLQQFLVSAIPPPKRIIFVDDKLDEIRSVEKVAKNANIEVHCFWYRQASRNRPVFNIRKANIQLEYLIKYQLILNDENAGLLLRTKEYFSMSPERHLKYLIELYEKMHYIR